MNRPKGQHFVQRAYLENFCDCTGRLNDYLLRSIDGTSIQAKWITARPASLGIENDLYTVNDGSPFAIERNLSNIEDSGIEAIRNLLARRPDTVPAQQSSTLASYISYAAARVPSALKLKEIMEPELRAGRILGHPVTPGPNGISHDATAIAGRLNDLRFYLKLFDGRPGTELVTSDRPVSLYAAAEWRHGRLLQASPVDSSLPDCWGKNIICLFPISTTCVVFGCRGPKKVLNNFLRNQLSLRSHAEEAAWINAMTGFWANHIYSATRDPKFLSPGQTLKVVSVDKFVEASEAYTAETTIKWPPTNPTT